MKREILLIIFIIGLCGTAVMFGYIMGSGQLMSHEASKDFEVNEPFDELKLDTVAAQVNIVPSEDTRVTAYAKAWLPEPVRIDDVVDVRVEDSVLTIVETPYPSKFFGVFPQPYELILTVYMPVDMVDTFQEAMEQ